MAATALGAAALAGGASADVTWAFNAGIANDYVFRGIDQTTFGSSGEAFGGVDLTVNQFYAGTWVSNTGPDFDRGYEYDIYGGWRPSAMGVNWDLGAIFYGYTDSPGGFVSHDFNTFELRAGGTLPIGAGSVGAVVFWSPDFAGTDSDAEYAEINAAYTFHNHATLSGAVGRQFVDSSVYGIDGYTTWNVGVTYPITEHIAVDLRYVDTDDDAETFAGGLPQDQHLIATLKATF
jgi:uncharacterized protein (TIGR02001 family)